MNKIPMVDLKSQYLSIKQEIDEAIQNTLNNSSFILGPSVEKLEKDFATYCNVKYALGTNSGTSALHLALLALGIKQGDEVITSANTFIATLAAISHAGATPVLLDIDKETYDIDVNKIEAAITTKTKAIMPVHLYGHPCEMDKIKEISEKHNIPIIEDCAQAHGAEYKGRKVGSFGDISCFSFYPSKNLGAYGEGGLVITNNEEYKEKVRVYRDQGQQEKYLHKFIGYNYRLEGIQGAILAVKLKYLDRWNEQRRNNAKLYNSLLEDTGVSTPIEKEHVKHVYHVYSIRTNKREELMKFLNDNNISTAIHYPIPTHLQESYKHLGHNIGSFPLTEDFAKKVLSLPMYPELTVEQIGYISNKIKEFKFN